MSTATISEVRVPEGTWDLDEVHTKVGFAVKHMGVSTVRGEFRDFDGGLESAADGSLRAYGTVRAASVSTNQEQRDEHLRSADFFDAEEYHQDYYKKNPDNYHAYRRASGREAFLARTWGTASSAAPSSVRTMPGPTGWTDACARRRT